jgi:hypothetical protein
VGSTLALAQPHYYDRLVQLASTIKFVHHRTFFFLYIFLKKNQGYFVFFVFLMAKINRNVLIESNLKFMGPK